MSVVHIEEEPGRDGFTADEDSFFWIERFNKSGFITDQEEETYTWVLRTPLEVVRFLYGKKARRALMSRKLGLQKRGKIPVVVTTEGLAKQGVTRASSLFRVNMTLWEFSYGTRAGHGASDLSNLTFAMCNFRNVEIGKGTSNRLHLKGCVFRSCDFRGAVIPKRFLKDSLFIDCLTDGATFGDGTPFPSGDFSVYGIRLTNSDYAHHVYVPVAEEGK